MILIKNIIYNVSIHISLYKKPVYVSQYVTIHIRCLDSNQILNLETAEIGPSYRQFEMSSRLIKIRPQKLLCSLG